MNPRAYTTVNPKRTIGKPSLGRMAEKCREGMNTNDAEERVISTSPSFI
jgi:hypothetical protein